MKTIPKFLTAYDGIQRTIPTPSGEKLEPKYEYKETKDEGKKLVITGETDIYAKIQEHLEDTKIENILKRASAGDNSVFRPDGIYEDFADVPKDFISQNKYFNDAMETLKDLSLQGMSEDANGIQSTTTTDRPLDDSKNDSTTGGNEK